MASKQKTQWRQILEAAEDQGLLVERPGERYNGDGSRKKGGSHIRVSNPETGAFIFVACTPSDFRALRNDIAWMRRDLGFVWNGR